MFNFGTLLVAYNASMILRSFLLCLLLVTVGHAQRTDTSLEQESDTTQTFYYIIEGDTIPREHIDLQEVVLLRKLEFDSKQDRRRYLILRRKTRKVYPYAKLAAERLMVMTQRLETLDKQYERKRYTKRIQHYIEGEFSDRLKKLTRTEGQILVKLIHRQTGTTAFDLVKDLRTGWRAFWYNTTASMFDISLKEAYRPFDVKEDYLIEDILERSFREGLLERQAPAFEIDYLELTDHWDRVSRKN